MAYPSYRPPSVAGSQYDRRPPQPLRPDQRHPYFWQRDRSPATPIQHRRYPWELPRRKRMTIVAGFRVQDGVVLCSDTQYTGNAKIYQRKLFPITIGADHYVFGLSGHEPNGKMAIDECEDAISELAPGKRTLNSVKRTLRLAVKPVIDDYVLSRPESERGVLEFELLVGCWIPDGAARGHRLLAIRRNGAVNKIGGYDCIGVGSYLGDYLMRPTFFDALGLDAVMLLAAQSLRSIKAYDASCGGPSSFEVIKKDGTYQSVPYDFYHADLFLATYEAQERSLLYFIAPQNDNESHFELKLKEFTETMKSIREAWVKADADRKNLIKAGFYPSSPTIS
jgi:20S proteasome alpha/beta subunit